MSAASPEPLSAEAFAEAENVSRETLERLRIFLTLLERWQQRINLVGKSTLEDPWRRHMQDSIQLASLIEGPTIVDLGSGAGLPGLVLAIARPELLVHLVESDARKCAFLREAARETGANATVHHCRIEAISPFPCDTVTARALAPLSDLLTLSLRFTPRLYVFPKGRDAERELTESTKGWRFEVERIPSRSDPHGAILRLWGVDHVSPGIRDRQPEGRRR
jgi:16S rRNA (guanine527-N7)-methyltransferase